MAKLEAKKYTEESELILHTRGHHFAYKGT